MACKVLSLGLQGVTGYLVTTEVDLSGGLPNFDIVGLPANNTYHRIMVKTRL